MKVKLVCVFAGVDLLLLIPFSQQKTTLMNHILNDPSHKMKFAVIENEFGDVGIDEEVLSENVEEEVIEGKKVA